MVFGNLFRNHSNQMNTNNHSNKSTKGLFYSGRVRMFYDDPKKVHPAGKGQGGSEASTTSSHSTLISANSLLKPIEYRKQVKQNAQRKKLFLSQNLSFPNVLKISTQQQQSQPPLQPSRSTAKLSTTIILNHPVKGDEEAWCLEEYGGVKMWVNNNTGDVSVQNPTSPRGECPNSFGKGGFDWLIPRRRDSIAPTSSSNTKMCGTKKASIFISENREVQEAFDLLNPNSALKLSVLENFPSAATEFSA